VAVFFSCDFSSAYADKNFTLLTERLTAACFPALATRALRLDITDMRTDVEPAVDTADAWRGCVTKVLPEDFIPRDGMKIRASYPEDLTIRASPQTHRFNSE
jgi:hypothetical protein